MEKENKLNLNNSKCIIYTIINGLKSKKTGRSFFILISLLFLLGAWKGFLPMSLTEVLGFVTGAACVWLTVKENIWNWPIGIANSIFFIFLFWGARLYADMGLQVVYVILGVLGWYWWLTGGENKTELPVSRIGKKEALVLAFLVVAATYFMTQFLQSVNDAAPFWDALTTILSLAAQYMLTKKYLENWYVWITADVIYIALYIYKDLYLTGLLYLIFLGMCLVGLREWDKSFLKKKALKEVKNG